MKQAYIHLSVEPHIKKLLLKNKGKRSQSNYVSELIVRDDEKLSCRHEIVFYGGTCGPDGQSTHWKCIKCPLFMTEKGIDRTLKSLNSGKMAPIKALDFLS